MLEFQVAALTDDTVDLEESVNLIAVETGPTRRENIDIRT